jgi:hypothetical protein
MNLVEQDVVEVPSHSNKKVPFEACCTSNDANQWPVGTG